MKRLHPLSVQLRQERASSAARATISAAREQAAKVFDEYAETMEDWSDEAASSSEMVTYRAAGTVLRAHAQALRGVEP